MAQTHQGSKLPLSESFSDHPIGLIVFLLGQCWCKLSVCISLICICRNLLYKMHHFGFILREERRGSSVHAFLLYCIKSLQLPRSNITHALERLAVEMGQTPIQWGPEFPLPSTLLLSPPMPQVFKGITRL